LKILIVPDKFKYTLTAQEVADVIEKSLSFILPNVELHKLPAADGGEGSSEIIASSCKAEKITIKTLNPVFREILTFYYYSYKHKTAFIDLSAASGLQFLKPENKNPMHTSTYGTGEMILDAINIGAKKIYLSAGGSGTNDAACGAAEAIGFKFSDKKNKQIKKITGKDLVKIAKIDSSDVRINLKDTEITVLYDVRNPLYGKNGAAYIYAPQKGADKKETAELNKGLNRFADIVTAQYGININECSGCGAAGGFGAGSKIFFNAVLKPGARTILDLLGFDEIIKNVDLIITGEGKFDTQSYEGKLTGTVINAAKQHQLPIFVICGINETNHSVSEKYDNLHILPLYKTFPGLENAKKESISKIREVILKSELKNFM
jgi:glycerate 2-kinase